MFYTDVERDYLKGSDHTIIKISKKKYDERHDYDVLCCAVPEIAEQISFDEFLIGKIWASTRAYDLAFTDGEIYQVLVPYLEFGAINSV